MKIIVKVQRKDLKQGENLGRNSYLEQLKTKAICLTFLQAVSYEDYMTIAYQKPGNMLSTKLISSKTPPFSTDDYHKLNNKYNSRKYQLCQKVSHASSKFEVIS